MRCNYSRFFFYPLIYLWYFTLLVSALWSDSENSLVFIGIYHNRLENVLYAWTCFYVFTSRVEILCSLSWITEHRNSLWCIIMFVAKNLSSQEDEMVCRGDRRREGKVYRKTWTDLEEAGWKYGLLRDWRCNSPRWALWVWKQWGPRPIFMGVIVRQWDSKEKSAWCKGEGLTSGLECLALSASLYLWQSIEATRSFWILRDHVIHDSGW